MAQDPRYDSLFEPIQIGPVTAPNRFMQTPHGNGLGYREPHANAVWRGIRAEGGWGIVNTSQVEYHHSSDCQPLALDRLIDDADIPALALIADAAHEHGALAGAELCYNSISMSNYNSRERVLGPSSIPLLSEFTDPFQCKAMDKSDIRDVLRWQKTAALRAREAGFDLIYVFASSMLGLPFMFLSRRTNHRSDEYGGSLKNRARLLKEMIEVTRDAVGDTCAVPVRISTDELCGKEGWHKQEIIELLNYIGELPDLWDLTLSDWSNDSLTSRFGEEGSQEPFVAGLKRHTSKPVVGVGRFTSPDTMVAQIRRGNLDIVGAARASISDPFLPNKIREGRTDEIRECIGCNICIFHEDHGIAARCTQNPTAGEEWRKGWHPERIEPARSDTNVLVVGGGPAGLEAALALGQRGYRVTLAEATDQLGGRVAKEARLPGLSAWGRVSDYHTELLKVMPKVDIFLENRLGAEEIIALEIPHVVFATGSTWRRDGIGRSYMASPMPIAADASVLTPDDVMDGVKPAGDEVVVFDEDNYYMANVVAEKLARDGHRVTLVCSAGELAAWTRSTLESGHINQRMADNNITVVTCHKLAKVERGSVLIEHLYSGKVTELRADATVLVTGRHPNAEEYEALMAREAEWESAGIRSVSLIGDAEAPGLIAFAVYSGHRYAREFEADDIGDAVPYHRSRISIEEIL